MFSTPATLYPTLQLISEPDTGHALPPPLLRAHVRMQPTKSSPYTCLPSSPFLLSLYLEPFSFPQPPSVTSLHPIPMSRPATRLHDYSKLILTHYTGPRRRGTEWRPGKCATLPLSLSSFPRARENGKFVVFFAQIISRAILSNRL